LQTYQQHQIVYKKNTQKKLFNSYLFFYISIPQNLYTFYFERIAPTPQKAGTLKQNPHRQNKIIQQNTG